MSDDHIYLAAARAWCVARFPYDYPPDVDGQARRESHILYDAGSTAEKSWLRAVVDAVLEVAATSSPADREVVFGVPINPSPPGWRVEGLVVLARATDPDGRRRTFARPGGDMMLWEELGMLENERAAVLRMLAELPRDETDTSPEPAA